MYGKRISATILGAVTHYILGFLIYGLLLTDFMAANTKQYEGLMTENENSLWGYAISSVLFAFLLTYVLGKMDVKSGKQGLISAGLISFLFVSSFDLMFYFGMNLYNGPALVADVIAYTVMGSLTGLVVGFMLNRGGKSAEARA